MHEKMDAELEAAATSRIQAEQGFDNALDALARNEEMGWQELVEKRVVLSGEYKVQDGDLVSPEGYRYSSFIQHEPPLVQERMRELHAALTTDPSVNQAIFVSPDQGFGRHYIYVFERDANDSSRIQYRAVEVPVSADGSLATLERVAQILAPGIEAVGSVSGARGEYAVYSNFFSSERHSLEQIRRVVCGAVADDRSIDPSAKGEYLKKFDYEVRNQDLLETEKRERLEARKAELRAVTGDSRDLGAVARQSSERINEVLARIHTLREMAERGQLPSPREATGELLRMLREGIADRNGAPRGEARQEPSRASERPGGTVRDALAGIARCGEPTQPGRTTKELLEKVLERASARAAPESGRAESRVEPERSAETRPEAGDSRQRSPAPPSRDSAPRSGRETIGVKLGSFGKHDVYVEASAVSSPRTDPFARPGTVRAGEPPGNRDPAIDRVWRDLRDARPSLPAGTVETNTGLAGPAARASVGISVPKRNVSPEPGMAMDDRSRSVPPPAANGPRMERRVPHEPFGRTVSLQATSGPPGVMSNPGGGRRPEPLGTEQRFAASRSIRSGARSRALEERLSRRGRREPGYDPGEPARGRAFETGKTIGGAGSSAAEIRTGSYAGRNARGGVAADRREGASATPAARLERILEKGSGRLMETEPKGEARPSPGRAIRSVARVVRKVAHLEDRDAGVRSRAGAKLGTGGERSRRDGGKVAQSRDRAELEPGYRRAPISSESGARFRAEDLSPRKPSIREILSDKLRALRVGLASFVSPGSGRGSRENVGPRRAPSEAEGIARRIGARIGKAARDAKTVALRKLARSGGKHVVRSAGMDRREELADRRAARRRKAGAVPSTGKSEVTAVPGRPGQDSRRSSVVARMKRMLVRRLGDLSRPVVTGRSEPRTRKLAREMLVSRREVEGARARGNGRSKPPVREPGIVAGSAPEAAPGSSRPVIGARGADPAARPTALRRAFERIVRIVSPGRKPEDLTDSRDRSHAGAAAGRPGRFPRSILPYLSRARRVAAGAADVVGSRRPDSPRSPAKRAGGVNASSPTDRGRTLRPGGRDVAGSRYEPRSRSAPGPRAEGSPSVRSVLPREHGALKLDTRRICARLLRREKFLLDEALDSLSALRAVTSRRISPDASEQLELFMEALRRRKGRRRPAPHVGEGEDFLEGELSDQLLRLMMKILQAVEGVDPDFPEDDAEYSHPGDHVLQ